MKYSKYTIEQRTDDILDKISNNGISSLTEDEIGFLDAYSKGIEVEYHEMLNVYIFEDGCNYFKFKYIKSVKNGDRISYIGTLYTPDLKLSNGEIIEGKLEGRIVVFENGQISPDFFHIVGNNCYFDVFEFCNGLEYELDAFLDYVVEELKCKKNIKKN